MKGQKQDGQKTVRKSTAGVPRVTDKVLALDEAGRSKWLAEKCGSLNAEQKAEVEKRLAEAVAGGRKVKTVNLTTIFTGRSVAELTEAQTALTAALAAAAEAEEENLNRIIAKAEQQKAALAAARKAQAEQTA